jgi:hypothetical protein
LRREAALRIESKAEVEIRQAARNHVRVPSPLRTVDARRLSDPLPGRRRRRAASWLVVAAGVADLVVLGFAAQSHRCTETSPCGPDVTGGVIVGLVTILPFLGFVHLWLAATCAATLAVVLAGYDLAYPSTASPLWAHLVTVAVAAVCVLVASWTPLRYTAPTWPTELPPRPPGAVRAGRAVAYLGLGLIAAGLACGVWSTFRQAEADAQQQAARVIVATVVSHADEYTLKVLRADGQSSTVDVLDVNDYPVGQALRLAVDDRGLRQPLSEPYDASLWWLLVMVLGVPGVGLVWRFADRAAGLHRLFREPVAVSQVYLRRRADRVLLFAGDAGPDDLPFGEIEVRDEILPPVELVPGPNAEEQAVLYALAQPVESTVLYGLPVPGQWCTVTLDQIALTPRQPLQASTDRMPRGPAEGAPNEREPTADEIVTLRPEEVAAAPVDVHIHRAHRVVAFTRTLLLPLVAAPVVIWVAHSARPNVLYAVVAGVVAIGLWIGWQSWIRPVAAWNAGGLTVRGAYRRHFWTVPWSEVTSVDTDGEMVLVRATEDGHALPTLPRFGDRNAAQLAHALNHARDNARPGIDPPIPPAGDAGVKVLLLVLYLTYTVGLCELLRSLT